MSTMGDVDLEMRINHDAYVEKERQAKKDALIVQTRHTVRGASRLPPHLIDCDYVRGEGWRCALGCVWRKA